MRTQKLTSEEQIEVCRLLGWFWNSEEIVKYIKDTFKKSMTPLNIRENYQKADHWQPVIERFREAYLNAFTEVPLANKRKRLDELQKHYEHHMRRNNYRDAQAVIRDFRDEMTEKTDNISFSFTSITHNEFKDLSEEELMKEKERTIEQYIKARKMRLLAQGVKHVQEEFNAERNGTETESTGA